MALGFNYGGEGGSSDIQPRIEYNAKSGRFHAPERRQDGDQWITTKPEIPLPWAAVWDFSDFEVGHIRFAGGIVDFRMVKFGEPMPARPGDKDEQGRPYYRSGVRIKTYCQSLGVRVFSQTSAAALAQIDSIHTLYEAEKARHPGELPVVTVKGVQLQNGGQQSNYAPLLEITKWVPRPAALGGQANGATQPAATAAPAPTQPVEETVPPPANPVNANPATAENEFV